ncbi:MAG: hypothetical protein A3F84_13815 [Candidatus Handelsmanbacteria bacterium RIFCSPLOWO2_12_FULL_64_10]|uniref:Neutral/alkaline non-lysosomal ceramidase N-terminal domain-containing protein n=1 Tax=Handelsmanbacteria sp. (strain RIFCSPLOWO2_12_FULL_64_10) TaxID=1817868 RepID=A0A1F6D0S4_HANXR|nr:MAG: hypothetical protein A3F84_13815 [Candidatus Handelsmanbacteria bacterium RIFCSPLOWO2_12_FULL_64_10]
MAELKAGTGRADITPDPAMTNWVDMKPYDGVLDRIAVRALAVGDGETEAVFVCWDLIDAGEEAVAQVRRAVREATGVPETHVLVAASHTHSAPRSPFTGASLTPGRGERMRPLLQDPVYRAWAERLPGVCAEVAQRAKGVSRPVNIAVGRANAGEWLFNRRPVDPEGKVVTMFQPKDPHSLPDGLRFGPVDPTLTVLTFQDPEGKTVATLFSVPCHSVSIYPHHRGVSADWPGPACAQISAALGGEALFLQGCAGEVVPGRRGEEARAEMARFFAGRALAAVGQRHPLPSAPLRVARRTAGIPLTPEASAGGDIRPVEIQVIARGPFALVTLPGEPLNGLAREVQARSPFPHTLVVGYANGRGVGYVGLPGEKARGGYEAGAGRGTEEAGLFLIETAVRLLKELEATP